METLKEELNSQNYGIYPVCSWLAEYHSGLLPLNHEFKRDEVLIDLHKRFFPIRETTLDKIYDSWNEGKGPEEIKEVILNPVIEMETETVENLLVVGKTVFFTRTEDYWDKPYVMKRHHVYDIREIILRGEITEVQGEEFSAKLVDNNGFEKDGQTFVFHKDVLLKDQDFKDFDSLGKWKKVG